MDSQNETSNNRNINLKRFLNFFCLVNWVSLVFMKKNVHFRKPYILVYLTQKCFELDAHGWFWHLPMWRSTDTVAHCAWSVYQCSMRGWLYLFVPTISMDVTFLCRIHQLVFSKRKMFNKFILKCSIPTPWKCRFVKDSCSFWNNSQPFLMSLFSIYLFVDFCSSFNLWMYYTRKLYLWIYYIKFQRENKGNVMYLIF